MNLNLFTIISGIASIIGLILQISDIFPAHREVRKTIFILIIGIFIGTLIGTLQTSSIKIDVNINSLSILVGAIILIVAILCFSAAITNDPVKRGELFGAAGIGVFVLLIVLFVGFLFTAGDSVIKEDMTVDECIYLADKNAAMGSIDRAIFYLEKVKIRLSSNDSRKSFVEQRIENLKKDQFDKK